MIHAMVIPESEEASSEGRLSPWALCQVLCSKRLNGGFGNIKHRLAIATPSRHASQCKLRSKMGLISLQPNRSAVDQEEIAGPVPAFSPIRSPERFASMDVLRGIALLGILIANVSDFGLPGWDYLVPLSASKAVFTGPHSAANTAMWFARWLIMEGKMRALFSLLFGAGVILLTGRIEHRQGLGRAADIYLRRNMWLVLFGVLHGYLLYHGDILYFYGLIALLFLYPCRNLQPRTLAIAGLCLLGLCMCINPFASGTAIRDIGLHQRVLVAEHARLKGEALSTAQLDDMKSWQTREQEWRPGADAVAADLAAARGGIASNFRRELPAVVAYERDYFYSLVFLDMLPIMLFGMALCKTGFLKAEMSARTYGLTALAGAAISIPVVSMATWKSYQSGFDMLTSEKWLYLTYDVGRVSGMLAIASLGLFCVKKKFFPRVLTSLAAVGQMALSNYLLTSLLCNILFFWGPWKLYGLLEYYQLYYVVAGVWLVNLLWSGFWLRRFQFGPAEWLWRSLTYWKRQPLLLPSTFAEKRTL